MEGPSAKVQVDKIDLEIIKRLQRDETKPLSEIQKETGINYKTLSFHHRKHVLGRQMLKGHKVNWIGTAYNPENDRGKHRRHTYQPIDIMLKDVTPGEKATRDGPRRTPSRSSGGRLPGGAATTRSSSSRPTRSRRRCSSSRAPCSPLGTGLDGSWSTRRTRLSFGLEPRLYDNESRSWKFNQSEVLGKFEQLLLQIKRGP